MSSDVSSGVKIDDPVARELPAMRAAWPAWALLALVGLNFFFQIARGAPDDIDGLHGLTLSTAALEQGQWWTLLTHVVVQRGFFGHIMAMVVLTLAGLATLAARDKDWMGGWRTIAVFVVVSAAGALMYFLSGATEPLTGMWPGLLGLGAFYLASGRSVAATPPLGEPGSVERKRAVGGSLSGWFFLWLTIGNSDLRELLNAPDLGIWVWAAVFAGGVATILLVNRWGPTWATWLLVTVQLCIYALFLALLVVGGAKHLLSAPAQPLVDAAMARLGDVAALLGAGAIGLALGFAERAMRILSARD